MQHHSFVRDLPLYKAKLPHLKGIEETVCCEAEPSRFAAMVKICSEI